VPDFTVAYADAPESIPPSAVTFNPPLPTGLKGAFVRNGPGIQQIGGRKQALLDGYGFIASLRIDDGRATLTARHVDTPVWRKERAAGKQLERKPFTNLPGRLANLFKINVANPAAHDVYTWGDKLVASDAPGHFLLDPVTLETVGEPPLNKWSKLPAVGPPMPRIDPATGRLVTYFTAPGLGTTRVVLREFGPDWEVVRTVSGSIPGMNAMLHDLAISPRWVAMAEFGRLSPLKLLSGTTLWHSLDPGSTQMRLVLLDREKGGKVHELMHSGGRFAFHLPNMWEDGDAVELLAVTYDHHIDFNGSFPPDAERPGKFGGPTPSTLERHRYVPGTKQHTVTPIRGPMLEAPLVNPGYFGRKNRFVWGPTPGTTGDEEDPLGYFYFHGICRIDCDQGQHQVFDFGPRTYVSPPAFAQKPGTTGEDEGWLLSWVTDAATRKSGVAVFDAAAVDKGPISRGTFDVLLPAVSHCEFVAAADPRSP
jgi:all-trans-8'-apo-beta-carotenal 15,15'-oxygenase